jgi:nitrite reductase (NADH) large subunit
VLLFRVRRAAAGVSVVRACYRGEVMIRQRREALVMIGNGMAGVRAVEEILARDPDRFSITVFGDEPCAGYNRIQLSAVLGGFKDADEVVLHPFEWYEEHGIRLHAGVRAERIDLAARVVAGRASPLAAGRRGGFELEEPFDRLVIATGSRPFVPPVEGADKQNVFLFRTLLDCAAIAEQARKSKKAVVLGGGLLGLEAARGLLSHDVEVTVVEAAPHLMPQQLDPAAAALLRKKLEGMGVRVLLQKQTTRALGNGRVEALELKDGATLDADMLVISCGIRANSDLAKLAGLAVGRAIVVDDQMRTSAPDVFAVGECAEHRGVAYGLVEPLYEQARVLADVLTGAHPEARYEGSRLATTLKVMGVDLTSMGDVNAAPESAQVFVYSDPERGLYRKLVVRDGRLAGAVVLGDSSSAGPLLRLFKRGDPVPEQPLDLLLGKGAAADPEADVAALPDDAEICNCHRVPKGRIVEAIRAGCKSVQQIGAACKAGTGCGSCQPLLGQLLGGPGAGTDAEANKIERMKKARDGLDCLPDVLHYARTGNWEEMTEDDKQRFKWQGLFFRKQTPGHFMLRIRLTCGFTNARQFRVIADMSDEFGKGFCDLTTRQQIQMRWFTVRDAPEIWRRLDEVGLNSKQTGMDNIRGVCGCPLAGLTPHELFDASPAAREFTDLILDNKDYTNLPRKFNVTITGCLENCCHPETQDIGLVPAYRELDGQQVNGFNVLVGGKQGSGGYEPAKSVDVFVRPAEAARLCGLITQVFRDHGDRTQRTRARLYFLLESRGVAWFRAELERRWGGKLLRAGSDLRRKHHVDHLGIHPQRRPHADSPSLFYAGLLVPVGRITTAQMRGVADLAERYGNGDVRLTTGQNLVIPNIPEDRVGAFTDEPLLGELPFDPSPVMRGLVACVGSDYCHFALIETKGWAVQVARELEKRTAGHKVAPLSIHWSGCPAGCGLHQVGTIGLQGCRSRVNGEVVDAAHVFIQGKTGPEARHASDLMYDVPCDKLPDALESIVKYLPR